MSVFLPFQRATLLVPSGPQNDQDRKHLFILLTNPYADEVGKKCVVMVSVSSIRQGLPYDETCRLYVGDHPFLRRDSFVAYKLARIEESAKLLAGVKAGLFVPHDMMDSMIFARVCKGLEESRQTNPRILKFYRMAVIG